MSVGRDVAAGAVFKGRDYFGAENGLVFKRRNQGDEQPRLAEARHPS